MSSSLKDGAMLVRRTPLGFTKKLFDVCAQRFAAMAGEYNPGEAKPLAVDGAKVPVSASGVRALLNGNVHVIAEPSTLSNQLHALDSPSTFGRFQPAVRKAVRRLQVEIRDTGRTSSSRT